MLCFTSPIVCQMKCSGVGVVNQFINIFIFSPKIAFCYTVYLNTRLNKIIDNFTKQKNSLYLVFAPLLMIIKRLQKVYNLQRCLKINVRVFTYFKKKMCFTFYNLSKY